MIVIDEEDRDKGKGEKGVNQEIYSEVEFEVETSQENPCPSLHKWILEGDPSPATTASPSQDEEAQNWNIVVGFYQAPTLGTARGRLDYRYLSRNPVDTDVEEAPQTGTEDEEEN